MWIPKVPKVPSGAIAIVFVICCIYPYIMIFEYIGYCLHKDQVTIEQTVYEGITWRDEGYVGGTDYLNFSVEIAFKKKEVSKVYAHTLVFKDNKYIGHIQSTFEGTSEKRQDATLVYYFEPNSIQKMYFHLSHPTNRSWENNEVFKELYYGNAEDFTFTTNVIYVAFTDGVVVGHNFATYYYDENGIIYYKDENSHKDRYYYYDDKGRKRYA